MKNQPKIPFRFTPLMLEAWDAEPSLSKAEILVMSYITYHHIGYGNDSVRLSDEELRNGRKRKGGGRMDNGCGVTGPNNIRNARLSLQKRGWIIIEEDMSDKARPKRWYKVNTDSFSSLNIESAGGNEPEGNDPDTQRSVVEGEVHPLDIEQAESVKSPPVAIDQDTDSNTRTYIRNPKRNINKKILKDDSERGTLVRPSKKEVINYFVELAFNDPEVQGEMFWNHYQSNGWLVGQNPMKDWQASATNWNIKNKASYGTHGKNNSNKGSLKSDEFGSIPQALRLGSDCS